MIKRYTLFPNKFMRLLCQLFIFVTVLIMSAGLYAMGGMSIFDGIPTEAACRNCHDDLVTFPMLEETNSVKHHLLLWTPIPNPDESTAPDAPGGVPGEPYVCMSCHEIIITNGFELGPFRDCLLCHPVSVVTGSPMHGANVHHKTETFFLGDCYVCHGDGTGGGGMGGMGGMGGRGH